MRRFTPALLNSGMTGTGMDQLWRADITYVRLREEFIFVAVILDAYSRRVIGWALDWTMDKTLTLRALRMALSRRVVGPDLVHHSDCGSQYASGDYTDLLKENGIAISMSRKGNPWDNAACESFMKTRLAMCHPQSSKLTSSDNKRKPLRDRFLDELFSGIGKSFNPCDSIGPGTASLPSPASSSR